MSNWLILKLLILPGLLIGISFHEFAHAYMAYKLGDSTAKDSGRMTIEPWAHIDVLGFIFFLIIGIGWASPVPVNTRNFKKPVISEILVSLAGPLMNLIIAIFFIIIEVLINVNGWLVGFQYEGIIYSLLYSTIIINIALALFNLIPIPPLDGSHIVYNILPKTLKLKYLKIQELQGLIILILLFTNVLSYIVFKPAEYIYIFLVRLIYNLL